MADNIKISDLTELTSGSLRDATIFPVVDGGTTKRASLSSLQSYLTDDLATDTELSTQISTVNSTINALTTDDISEGSNLYYTNARVTTHIEDLGAITSSQMVDALQIQNLNSAVLSALGGSDIISGSITTSSISNFPTEVSRSAAAAGFGTGGGGGGTGDIEGVTAGDGISGGGTTGTVTVSLNTGSTHFTTGVSASAAAAGFGAGGGGGSTDYISNISLSNSTLTFTGQGSAFNGTIDLSIGGGDGGNLATTTELGNYLEIATWETDSGSFASRLDSAGGGGAADWNTLNNKPVGIVSSSAQIDASQTDLSSLTTDDIAGGSVNRYYTSSLVLEYLNQLQVVSGSAGGGFSVSGTNIVSSSAQIDALGFVTNQTYGAGTASLQNQIDLLSGSGAVNVSDVNTFTAVQKFTQGIEVTGSVLLSVGSFSGSGANLSNIPASAIIGTVATEASSLSDGNNSVTVAEVSGISLNANTGSILANGDIVIQSGSLISGSGAGLFDIPGSAIIGGVDGRKIASSSFSASITDDGELLVGPYAIFESNVYSSGSVTAQSISVGTSGTPTIYSANNLNLSASNAVVVTDSPLRIGPFTDTITGSFTPQRGDIVYSSDSDDFYGYKVVNSTGSWYSLTISTVSEIDWDYVNGKPIGLVSSSTQVADLGGGLVSSSAQILPSGSVAGAVYFESTLDEMTSSADFTYTVGTETLTVPTMSVGSLTYSSLSGPAAATGSFNLVDADRILINNTYELPTSDGTADQVIKTNGSGIATFGNVAWGELEGVPSGIISSSVQLPTDIAYENTANIFTSPQTITGSLFVSSSTITDILVLPQRDTKPTLPETGSIIVSASSLGEPRPFFYDGTAWTQMFA